MAEIETDVAIRFDWIKPWWQHCRRTGYSQAVRLAAKHVFGIEHINGPSLAGAEARFELTGGD